MPTSRHFSASDPPDLPTLAAQVAQLSKAERAELMAILQAIEQAEDDLSQRVVDRYRKKQEALNRRGIRGGRGSFEDKYIRGYGPYRYLRYWYGKTHKSVYLGKVKVMLAQAEAEQD
jgi:hypothetical protein